MKVIGLMSGTSADGVDAALAEITGRGILTQVKLLAFEQIAYPGKLRQRVLRLSSGSGGVDEMSHLNFTLGEVFARAALKMAQKADVSIEEIQLIGSHGQTVAHCPRPVRDGSFRIRSTLQIGEPSVIAERTGITTVADFRTRDIAAGGQGAPLTPYLHFLLFQNPQKSTLVVNLGGIANVTWLKAGTVPEGVLAFDTGPGNMLIDGLVEHWTRGKQLMDRDGRIASRGKVHPAMLRELMRHPYLKQSPPKTTGREEFGRDLVEKVRKQAKKHRLKKEEAIATVTAWTARTIVDQCERYIYKRGNPDQVVVGGGGTRNAALMKMLREFMGPRLVLTFEDFGLESRAVEALSFALMAYQAITAEPSNIPVATGARREVMMGKIVPGKNWPFDLGENVIEKLWRL